jgi:cell division protein FtsI (penicillin-binding protein 3)
MDQALRRRRLLIVAILAAVWMAAVLVRLAYLQLFCYREYLARARRQQQHVVEVAPQRGEIHERNMHPLAMSIPVDSCFAVPSEITDQELAARLLSGVLGIPRGTIATRLASSRSFVWVARKLPPEKAQAIAALNLKGVYFQKESQRFYPKRGLAAHVLGYVDIDGNGLGGIEYELDSQIHGRPGRMLVLEDARRRWFARTEQTADAGPSVVLTLDEKIQYIAEKELGAAIERTRALAGTVIVENPNDGEIYAMANWPSFNPNAAGDSPTEARMDRAISALYEPGSTFKLITLAAAFEERITRPDEVFDCQNGAVYIAGHRIRDHQPFGLLTVAGILAHSSDVGAIKIALRLGAPKFYQYIRAFGFGAPTGVDLPGESKGLVRPLENWTPISVGSISMGQEIGVTPIQLLSAVSAIANGGLLYRPHVVKELRQGSQILALAGERAVSEPGQVLRPQTAATLRHLMEGVILDGTGKLARLDGWTAAGKTGTAQKIDPTTGRYSRTQLIASFTGFAPLNQPAVAIIVSLDSPVGLHEGGQVAAPVFKRVAEQVLAYLDVPRDVPLKLQVERAALRGRAADASAEGLEDFTPANPEAEAPLGNEQTAVHDGLERSKSAAAPTLAVADEDGVPVPALTGKTMREVTEECLRLGLEPVLVGTGLALDQTPEAGAGVHPGSRITIRFGSSAADRGRSRARQ